MSDRQAKASNPAPAPTSLHQLYDFGQIEDSLDFRLVDSEAQR